MADDADIANDQQARLLSAAIQHVARAACVRGESPRDCAECGDPIPTKRRSAQPGCTLCVDCQNRMEK